jgi:hypothetical protein
MDPDPVYPDDPAHPAYAFSSNARFPKGNVIQRFIGDPDHIYNYKYYLNTTIVPLLHWVSPYLLLQEDPYAVSMVSYSNVAFRDPGNGDFTVGGAPPGESAQDPNYGKIGFKKIPIYDINIYR